MSLDVHLTMPGKVTVTDAKIFIREDGQNKEITLDEWRKRFPDKEPFACNAADEVFDYNITHNLNEMADQSGIYKALWQPEEIGITHARQLIEPLTVGLAKLQANPDYYRTFNPANGWGDFVGLFRFVEAYLTACKKYPDAEVRVSR